MEKEQSAIVKKYHRRRFPLRAGTAGLLSIIIGKLAARNPACLGSAFTPSLPLKKLEDRSRFFQGIRGFSHARF